MFTYIHKTFQENNCFLPAQKLGHNVLCTGGKTIEKRGRKMGKKEEEREKVLKKSLIFTKKQGVEKGEEIFTNNTQNKWLAFLLQMVTSKTSGRFYV